MSTFEERMQALVNESEPGTIALVMRSVPEVMAPGSEWNFTRSAEAPFVAQRLILSRECANLIEVLDLRLDRYTLFRSLLSGIPPFRGELFKEDATGIPLPFIERRGYGIHLKVRNPTDKPVTGFNAVVISKVKF